jgi:DNA (cytosine-5)-methyltransferase 1
VTAFLDLFSGIGGFALGAYWTGLRFDNHYFSEVEPYAVELYQKRFPNAEPLGDIRDVDYSRLPEGEYLVSSGFPCQPHSVAGKKKGARDERDLWPECARMLRELRPAVALFENVPGLFVSNGGRFFNRVLSDISEGGYDAEWQVISAKDQGAPHIRKRVWIVAYADNAGNTAFGNNVNRDRKKKNEKRENEPQPQPCGLCANVAYAESGRRCNGHDGANQRQADRKINAFTDSSFSCRTKMFGEYRCTERWAIEPDVGRVAHGIPSRVDRLKGLGNAVVPQCVEMIFNLPAFDYWRKI